MRKLFARSLFMSGVLLMAGACDANESDTNRDDTQVVVEGVAEGGSEGTIDSPTTPAVFPAAFQGNWDYDQNGCVNEDSGTRFTITPTEIIGYEDTSTLNAVEVMDELNIRVRMKYESAEEVGQVVQIMRLSPVAGISMRIEVGDKTIRALRCDPV